jgi:metal-responsive CopG/Arc/MetJ family transcriptional regulator
MKRTTIMADEGTLLELKAIAQRQGKSTSQVIREALAEYVVTHRADGRHKNPLLALVGLGESDGETDVSERAEEILAAEIDPVRGWSYRDDHDR